MARDQAGEIIRKAAVPDGMGGYKLQVDAEITSEGATPPGSGAPAAVSPDTDSQVAAAENVDRLGLMLFNGSNRRCAVALAATAAFDAYSFILNAGAFYEFPSPVYTGAVSVIWDDAAATGDLMATELGE